VILTIGLELAPFDNDGKIGAALSWQVHADRRGRDARQCVDALRDLTREPLDAERGRILAARQRRLQRQHVRRFESRTHVAQRMERPNQQRGADEQDERERDLGDDERATRACRSSTAGAASATLFQAQAKVGPREVERGGETKEHTRDDRQRQRKPEQTPIEERTGQRALRELVDPRQIARAESDERTCADDTSHEADDRSKRREQEALDE
jgi:hypothetical protein